MIRPTPEIREIRSAELDPVLAIAAVSPEAPAWRPADYAVYLAGAQPPLLRTAFVAVAAGNVVGFAAATLLLDPAGSVNPENHCELDSMAVHPAARRQGIGSALLDAVSRWATAHNSRRLTLEVRVSNLAAIRLYERHGFQREGLRPRYYTAPVDDALLLGKPLRP